ncbi:DNA starvation/stationary phase protection protein Dps [Rhodobacteraceae bacterium KMM 6894]|nr:DNA starvation/stationary phase protection protein Dps [Rhodobacteraceae bacterium KMM 6894]
MTTTFKTTIDLDDNLRSSMVELLNQQLADTFDLHSQVKQAHWNVRGMNFMQLHLLYDQLAEELPTHIDTIAERAAALGGAAKGTARMAAKNSRLDDMPERFENEKQSVELLVARYAALAKTTRKAIDEAGEAGDADTADIFTAVSRTLDKSRWFLEAHLQ